MRRRKKRRRRESADGGIGFVLHKEDWRGSERRGRGKRETKRERESLCFKSHSPLLLFDLETGSLLLVVPLLFD